MPWFALLLAAHITLAVSLLVPSLVLPFVLREREASGVVAAERRPVRWLMTIQGQGSVVIGIGLALTGTGLLAVLGPDLLRRPWLLAALAVYAANLVVAAFISRPNLRRLIGRAAHADPERWQRRARRQRIIAYLMAAGTGLIGFLMSVKPEF